MRRILKSDLDKFYTKRDLVQKLISNVDFSNFDLVVEANQYEIIYSYFYSLSKSENVAKNFTTIIFRISNITGENPLILLEEIKGSNGLSTANALVAYYLNSLKSKTTLYGVSSIPQPNQVVARNAVI